MNRYRDDSSNPDRFDRELEHRLDRAREHEPREPVITSKRGARFVGHTFCFHCFFPRIGIEFHGELRDGTKVYQLAAHSQGAGSHRSGKPLCFGAHKRIEPVGDGTWKRVQ